MFSIRESTFETNSSSCHSLVICGQDLIEKLKNYELLYIGNYNISSDDYDIQDVELKPSCTLNKEQLVIILQEFLYKDLSDTQYSDYIRRQQQWLKNHEFEKMSIKEIVNSEDFDLFGALQHLGVHLVHPHTIFGGEKRSTEILFEKTFLDLKTEEPIKVLLTCNYC